jgi:putative phage-type endonuclease
MQNNLLTKEMAHSEWIEQRKKGIGGSDVAAVLGISPWKTSYKLWLEKTGKIASDDLSDNDSVIFGALLEDFISSQFVARTNHTVHKDNKIRFHPEYDFILANIDRLILSDHEHDKPGILEIKTTNSFSYKNDWLKNDIETVPDYYFCQLQHYYLVTGYTWGFFAVLVDGRKFKIFSVDRDDNFINNILLPAEISFYNNNIIADVPPKPEVLDLNYIVPESNSCLIADDEIYYLLSVIDYNKKLLKENEAKIKESEDSLKLLLADYDTLTDSNGKVLATYKNQKSLRFDTVSFKKEYKELSEQFTKPAQSRILRIKN